MALASAFRALCQNYRVNPADIYEFATAVAERAVDLPGRANISAIERYITEECMG